jgi:GH15 family glucan-1,4-alpha-glucosidase
VDASLLGLAVPYGVVSPDDPIMIRSVEYIESTILQDGGVHRYAEDSYFGGGAWILLTAWLGWYYSELAAKRPDLASDLQPKIQTCMNWIETQAEGDHYLPEQVPENLNHPPYLTTWVERWGDIASPLLWSHANYILLHAVNPFNPKRV